MSILPLPKPRELKPKPKERLTDKRIKALPLATDKPYEVADRGDGAIPGLVMRVGRTSKTFYLRYGADNRLRIGRYPMCSLALAVEEARKHNAKIDVFDADPMEERRRKRQEAENQLTIARLCRVWWKEWCGIEFTDWHYDEQRRRLRSRNDHAFSTELNYHDYIKGIIDPALGEIAAQDLSWKQIKSLIEALKERRFSRPAQRPENFQRRRGHNQKEKTSGIGGVPTAKRVQRLLRQILEWAVNEEHLTRNPCKGHPIKRSEGQRHVRLTEEQKARLRDEINRYHVDWVRDAIWLKFLTGARSTELLMAEIGEFNLVAIDPETDRWGSWHIPANHTKGRKNHSIPLSRQAYDVVQRRLQALANPVQRYDAIGRRLVRDPLQQPGELFPGSIYRDIRVGTFNTHWHQIRRRAGLDNLPGMNALTAHDLRQIFGSTLFDEKANPAVVRDLLGHSSIEMTNQYVDAFDQAMVDAVARAGARITGQAPSMRHTLTQAWRLLHEAGIVFPNELALERALRRCLETGEAVIEERPPPPPVERPEPGEPCPLVPADIAQILSALRLFVERHLAREGQTRDLFAHQHGTSWEGQIRDLRALPLEALDNPDPPPQWLTTRHGLTWALKRAEHDLAQAGFHIERWNGFVATTQRDWLKYGETRPGSTRSNTTRSLVRIVYNPDPLVAGG